MLRVDPGLRGVDRAYAVATGVLSPDSIDLSARSFWETSAAERERAFAVLRRERPVSWHGPPESVLVDPEDSTGGYWAVVRHEDVTFRTRLRNLRTKRTFPFRIPTLWARQVIECSGRSVEFLREEQARAEPVL